MDIDRFNVLQQIIFGILKHHSSTLLLLPNDDTKDTISITCDINKSKEYIISYGSTHLPSSLLLIIELCKSFCFIDFKCQLIVNQSINHDVLNEKEFEIENNVKYINIF